MIECQSDLFQLLDQQQTISSSSLLTDRRWRLQLFIGYYTFVHQHVDFLFAMDSFMEKLLRFIYNSLDFEALLRSNLNLLNESSLSDHNTINFDNNQYHSVYKYLRSDVHDEIQQIIKLFISSNSRFLNYLFEQINQKKIIDQTNQKVFYLLSIIFEDTQLNNTEDYNVFLSLLSQLICDDDYRKQTKRRKRNRIKQGKILN